MRLEQEQWIALYVPAWQEGGVVNKMAEYASKVVMYEKYDIFIGVYPNDPETNECVDNICALNPRIHKVVVPHPGPQVAGVAPLTMRLRGASRVIRTPQPPNRKSALSTRSRRGSPRGMARPSAMASASVRRCPRPVR